MSILLIISLLYIAVGILYSWKMSKDIRSLFQDKKQNKEKHSNKKVKKIFNPAYLPWFTLEVVLVLFWLPILIYERKIGLQ
ncbi:hypothetical protein [Alkalihalobacillus sp. BA299]|uniref:hypothetical protein n=1 Tax=Alkalihalobacillus sp. BA299 TaxID=2815938 RepID=UPI001ADB4171|nr:hypothetical protein [Alkalihalobacillus sp. BA299]